MRILILATLLILAPLGARAAGLVVWWEEGIYAEEDEAVREIIAAFEQETNAIEPSAAMFERDVLDSVTVLDGTTGRRGLYLLPMGLATNHVHVWKSLLQRAGFTPADVPKEWDAFWAFWCDEVQPAVRKALGRADLWGVGLSMSAAGIDTQQMWQFVYANEADYVTRDGRLVIDDPEIRQRLVKAMDSYTQLYRKGCTPPDSITWDAYSNNAQFLAQTVVMTPNSTLSIPKRAQGRASG